MSFWKRRKTDPSAAAGADRIEPIEPLLRQEPLEPALQALQDAQPQQWVQEEQQDMQLLCWQRSIGQQCRRAGALQDYGGAGCCTASCLYP